MFNWITRATNLVSASPRRVAARKRLGLEQFEHRLVPAGGIATVSVVNGTLIITGDGDAAGNDVRLLEQGTGQYDVQGQNGTQVRLGASGTPSTSLSVSDVSVDIKATFLDGPDRFTYTGLFGTKLRDMALNMGKGSDFVNANFIDIRNLSISQGAGDVDSDFILIQQNIGTNGGIRGSVSINNGGGSDTTLLEVKTGGNVKITSTGGDDEVRIENSSYIGGSLTVTNTSGSIGNDTRIQAGSVISKNVSITNGDHENINQILNGAFVGGNVTIKNGDSFGGTTQNNFSSATIGGNVSTTGTKGQQRTNFSDTLVGKNVTINSGAGTGSDTLLSSTVGGSYVNNKGAANDDVTVANSLVYGAFKLNLGGAPSSNSVDIDGLTVFGATSIASSSTSSTSISIDTSRFIGAVNITTGAGSDSVNIGSSGGANTFFHSALKISLGAGGDTLNLGTGSDIRVSGPATYTGGDGTDTINDDFGPFANIYLSTRIANGF